MPIRLLLVPLSCVNGVDSGDGVGIGVDVLVGVTLGVSIGVGVAGLERSKRCAAPKKLSVSAPTRARLPSPFNATELPKLRKPSVRPLPASVWVGLLVLLQPPAPSV